MQPNNTNILYRVFDSFGELLYVGATINPNWRFSKHASAQPWWDDADTIKLERYPSRQELCNAEIVAIRSENPRYNVVHAEVRKPWTVGARGKAGEGSVFQRADGGWMAVLEFPRVEGQRRRTKRKLAQTRERAEKNLELLKRERELELSQLGDNHGMRAV